MIIFMVFITFINFTSALLPWPVHLFTNFPRASLSRNMRSTPPGPLAPFPQNHSPITRRQILDFSKLKEFADNNFKFDKNGSKLPRWVENTVGKGEIAHYEQFLLFPQRFQKACFPRDVKKCHCEGMG